LERQFVAAGAGANADITVTGIRGGDILIQVLELPASGAAVDRTAAATIQAANTIRISAATTGNQVLVRWADLRG
jgi:hypothetical protein